MQPGGEGEHPPRSNGDGWINGILTGAERFLNAVLGSDTPSSSSSSTSGSVSSEEKGIDVSLAISTTRNGDLNQMERDSKMVDCLDQDLAVVSEINSKQAIEQLLMEETFSREECNNLVDLIQSRVIDSEQPITCEKDKMPLLNLGSSLSSPKFLSLGSSPYHTRNLEYTAINEAKKWLDAEKSSEGGRCMLKTNQLEFDPETGSSPVELARAYMSSLPQENCAKVYKRGCDSSGFGAPPERTKRVKLMVIAGSLDIPKFKQLDVNSSVQSSYQVQAPIGVNDTPILTAIPLDPVDLHVSKSYKPYDCSSKVAHNTDQLGNAWVPYATCAMDVPENRPGGCDPPIKMSASKLIINEGNIMAPNTSQGTRGGRARRGRRKSGAGNGVARNSCCSIANENGTKETRQKSPTPRPRRGRRAKLN